MLKWGDCFEAGHISKELVEEKPIIALYGCFQIGKSTLINCLLNHYAALTGKGLATTALTARYRYGKERLQYRKSDSGLTDITLDELHNKNSFEDICSDGSFHIEAHTEGNILKYCDIVDTPGFNANITDTSVALSILENINYCLFIITNRGLSIPEQEMLKKLSLHEVPISIIMNCVEGRGDSKWIPTHPVNQQFIEENQAWLFSAGIKTLSLGEKKIFPCNVLFYWSQQTDFEKCKSYIDRGDTVIKHIKNTLEDEDENTDSDSIVNLSQIPMLVESLKLRINGYNPITHKWVGLI